MRDFFLVDCILGSYAVQRLVLCSESEAFFSAGVSVWGVTHSPVSLCWTCWSLLPGNEKVRAPNIDCVHTLHSHKTALHVTWLSEMFWYRELKKQKNPTAPAIIKVHLSALMELSLTTNEALLLL